MADLRRRRLVAGAGALLAWPLIAEAQRAARIYRVGFFVPSSPGPRVNAFVQGLRDLGYIEGQNLALETRFADGRPERLPGIVQELLRWSPDVLVAGATIGALAAKRATTTVPVVFAGSSDPVAGGVVTNLARPGGNLTGLSLAIGEGFGGKWLELLRDAVPGISHVAALWSSSNAAAARFVKEVEAAARTFGARLDMHHAANAPELDQALAAIGASGARGLIVTPSPFATTQQRRLIEFAAGKRLPAMYFVEDFADAGGFMSYGPSIADSYRRAATYVDKILKGAKPADLPVEQPTKIDLTINLKTARALGVRVPQALLLRAERVIE